MARIRPAFSCVLGLFLAVSFLLPGWEGPAHAAGDSAPRQQASQGGLLEPSDLPGFGVAEVEELAGWLALAGRLTSGLLDRPVTFSDHSLFTHSSPFQEEGVISFLFHPLSAEDLARVDALAGDPAPLIAALADIAATSGAQGSPLQVTGGGSVGDRSISLHMELGTLPVAHSVDLLWSVRGEVLQSTWVVTRRGVAPTLPVEQIGTLVDERIQERFVGPTYRPAGTYVPNLTTYIPTPLDISTEPAVIGANLLLAALAMLPFAAAAELFTRLVGERERALREKGRLPGRLEAWLKGLKVPRVPGKRFLPTSLLRLLVVMLFYAVTFSLLDRTWKPFTLGGFVLFADMLLAYGIVGIADDIFQWRALRRWGVPAQLAVRPTNILLAVGSTLASRLIPLVPGLMFGTPEALVVDEAALTGKKRDRLLGISALTFLSLGFGLWGLTTLTALLQRGDPSPWLQAFIPGLEAFLLVIFAVALENSFVQMLGFPGGFGEMLRRRSRWLWLVLLVLVTFIFYHTLINPRGDLARALQASSAWILLVAVGIFVLLTFTWWLVERFRRGKPPAAPPQPARRKRIPFWFWLVLLLLVVMLAGSLLLEPGAGFWKGVFNGPESPAGKVLPGFAAARPASPAPAPAFDPPILLGKLCYVPEMVSPGSPYDVTLWAGVQLVAAQVGAQPVMATAGELTDDFHAQSIDAFVQESCDLILGSITLGQALLEAVESHPEQPFWSWGGDVGGNPVPANLWRMDSALDQGTYLAGYLAAAISQGGKVGTFGGADYPNIRAYMDCFVRGVSDYDQAHQARVAVLGWDVAAQEGLFAGDFISAPVGLFISEELVARGADVLLPVAGSGPERTGYGAGQAALAHAGVSVIGVDLDWALVLPELAEVTLTSVVIRFERSMAEAVAALITGEFTGGSHPGELENGVIALAPPGALGGMVPPALVDELAALANATPPMGCEVGVPLDLANLTPVSTPVPLPSLTPSLAPTSTPGGPGIPLTGERLPVMPGYYPEGTTRIEYPAGQPFYVSHGWSDTRGFSLDQGFIFTILLDGAQLTPDHIEPLYESGEQVGQQWYFLFPNGLTGTHVFQGTHLAPCAFALDVAGYNEPCSEGEIVPVSMGNLTIDFIP